MKEVLVSETWLVSWYLHVPKIQAKEVWYIPSVVKEVLATKTWLMCPGTNMYLKPDAKEARYILFVVKEVLATET